MPHQGNQTTRIGRRLLPGLLLAATASTRGGDWPGFMGPTGNGTSSETGLFASGHERLELGWKKPLGPGYSALAVAGGRVVATFSDGKSDVVIALAASDGREQWRYVLDDTYKGHDGSQDGPLSTPLIAQGHVFALAPRGKLVALDAAGGKEIWKVDLAAEHGAVKPHYGFTTSPMLAGGVLIVQGAAKGAIACGFDPATGKRLWSAGEDGVNYQSPIAYTHAGRPAILAAGDTKLACIDPKSGEVLWQQPFEGGGERGGPCLTALALDANRLFLKHQDDRSKVVEVAAGESGVTLKTVWDDPSIGKTYTPAVRHADHLYGYNNRVLACADAKTGKTVWRSREPGDGFLTVADGCMVIATKDGGVYVAKAGPEKYDQIAGLKVFDTLCWAGPSIADGSIYVRSMSEIARIDIRSGGMASREAGRHDEAGTPDLAGTVFGKFLNELGAAKDKPAAIDGFLKAGHSFPLIESDGRVVFVYRGPGDEVVVGGDLTGFGAKRPMRRVEGTDLFYTVVRLEPDARVAYGFVCDYKKVLDPLNPRKTTIMYFDDDLEMVFDFKPGELSWLAMPQWKPPSHLEPAEESRRGKFESHTVKSESLSADVAIDVYLPAGYEKGTDPLPVLYVHDGKTARGDLHLVETLDNLIGREIAPLIAVFINHQAPFFGPQDAYAKMAAVELPAFVDAKYRTIPKREGRAHFGTSFAAVSALYAAINHPDATGKVAMISQFGAQASVMAPVLKNAAETPLTVYLDWCKYDLRSDLEGWSLAKGSRELDALFRERGYKPHGGEAHDGSGIPSWQNRTDDALKALFPLKG